jgi:ubiquinone/menaquinone biosynthesis C-methylase UbiE
VAVAAFRAWVAAVSRGRPDDALRRLLAVEDWLFARIDLLAIDLDEGVHAKHRLIGYHRFFVERVTRDERVLDVGCGKGELAHDVAVSTGARVTGIDFNADVLAFARSRFGDGAVDFVQADALAYEPDAPFDVVVLSNVLEHIAERPHLLRRLLDVTRAARFLIRVPLLERDWLVALRRDLGLWHYGDPTHETEYTVEQFHEELAEAGLAVDELQVRWGEIWAVARPAR